MKQFLPKNTKSQSTQLHKDPDAIFDVTENLAKKPDCPYYCLRPTKNLSSCVKQKSTYQALSCSVKTTLQAVKSKSRRMPGQCSVIGGSHMKMKVSRTYTTKIGAIHSAFDGFSHILRVIKKVLAVITDTMRSLCILRRGFFYRILESPNSGTDQILQFNIILTQVSCTRHQERCL